MRRLRFVPRDCLVETTARTVHGRFLLRPSPRACDLIIGVIGRACRLTGMRVVACVFLSNHFHFLLRPRSAHQMARFMGYVMSNVARELGRLHGWRERFWARRYTSIVISEEEAAQVSRLRYLLSHGVKEGFVAAAEDWPGPHSARAMRRGEPLSGVWYDRTAEFLARRMGLAIHERDFATSETVALAPLPCWDAASPEIRQQFVAELLLQVETEARQQRRHQLPLGRQVVLRQHPHDRPTTFERRPAPAFHAASREARLRLVAAYRRFVVAFRRAAGLLRAGLSHTLFPEDSFPPALPYVARAPSG
jgi:hypothetical protein